MCAPLGQQHSVVRPHPLDTDFHRRHTPSHITRPVRVQCNTLHACLHGTASRGELEDSKVRTSEQFRTHHMLPTLGPATSTNISPSRPRTTPQATWRMGCVTCHKMQSHGDAIRLRLAMVLAAGRHASIAHQLAAIAWCRAHTGSCCQHSCEQPPVEGACASSAAMTTLCHP